MAPRRRRHPSRPRRHRERESSGSTSRRLFEEAAERVVGAQQPFGLAQQRRGRRRTPRAATRARSPAGRSSAPLNTALSLAPALRRHGATPSSALLQPRAGHGPLPLHGGRRDADGLGRLLDGEAAEVAQLDDARLLGIERGEAGERLVEREHVDVAGPVGVGRSNRRARPTAARCVVQRDLLGAPPRLAAPPGPGALHEDLPHRERGDGEEVRAVLELAGRSAASRTNASLTSAVACSVWPGRSRPM